MSPPHPSPDSRWLTPANGLTGVRFVLAPICAWALLHTASGLALAIFVAAVGTDLADGPLARRRGESSPLGGFLDHGTDASFASLGLAALAALGLVPAALPLLVLAAFTQYALDSRALAGQALRASALGRINGIAYFVLLGIPIVRDGLGLGWPRDALVLALGWLLVVTTLVSMGDRAWALLRRGASNSGDSGGGERA